MSFLCDICEKEFNSKKSMTNHRRWHDLPEYYTFQKNFKNRSSKIHSGKILSEETKKKISNTKISQNLINEKNHNWKGDDVSYTNLHIWIRKYKPKVETCEICGKTKKLELSNISGEYKRDINDFQWLCRSCHKIRHTRGVNN